MSSFLPSAISSCPRGTTVARVGVRATRYSTGHCSQSEVYRLPRSALCKSGCDIASGVSHGGPTTMASQSLRTCELQCNVLARQRPEDNQPTTVATPAPDWASGRPQQHTGTSCLAPCCSLRSRVSLSAAHSRLMLIGCS